jgi:hypothetical protein
MTNRALPVLFLAVAGLSCSQQDFVTDVPVRVVASSPSGGARAVPRGVAVEVSFSERMVPDSVAPPPTRPDQASAVSLEYQGTLGADGALTGTAGQVKAAITYSEENGPPRVIIVPEKKLLFSSRYRVQVSTTALRLRDNGPLPQAVSFTFDTEDPPPLRVLSVVPADGAAAQERAARLKVVFSEPVDCASLAAAGTVSEAVDPHPHTNEGGPTVAIPGTWDCTQQDPTSDVTLDGAHCATYLADCTVEFRPTNTDFRFRYSSQVNLSLAGGAEATAPVKSARSTEAGGRLVAQWTSSFRVVDPPPLDLLVAGPANGSTGIPRTPDVELAFSEPVDCDALEAPGAVTLSQKVDAHPRFGSRAGTVEPLAGTWDCNAPGAGSAEGPAACGDAGTTCRAVYKLATGSALELSAELQVNVAGGGYDAGVALAAVDRVESLRATTRGGQLPAGVAFQARAEDPGPLLVVSSLPGNGAGNVPVTLQTLKVALSRPVHCPSVTPSTASATVHAPVRGSTTLVTSTPWPLSVRCTPGNTYFDLEPVASGALPWSSTVELVLTGGTGGIEAADATTRGGQLPTGVTLQVQTEDPPTLRLVSAQPSGGATGVGASEPLVLSFSEDLDCASVNATSVKVRQAPAALSSGAAVPAPSDVACVFTCPVAGDARKASCAHAPFLPSAEVEVTLVGGVGNVDALESSVATDRGGQLPTTEVFHFRAEDPASLAVVGTSPNGNPGINVSANSDVRFTFSRAVRCSTVAGRMALERVDTGAAVAGTVTCTNGSSVGPSVDGTVVIFTPSAPLLVEKRYRATAKAGIEAVDATLVGGGPRGTLTADVSTLFDIAFENLKVASTVPAAGSQLAPVGTKVVLQFNQAVLESSLVACTPSSTAANCNVVVTRGASAFNWATGNLASEALAVDGTPSYDSGTFRWTLDPNDAANAPNLSAATQYTVTVKGGVAGPLGQNGVSRMPVDFSTSFRTSSAQLVLGLTPEELAQDVEAEDPICIDFVGDVDVQTLTAGGQQLTLTYTDAFGRTAPLPLDATTPYLVSGLNGATDRVCFNLSNTPYACGPGEFRLRPGTTYTASVSSAVSVGGTTPAAPFSWSFSTRPPPALSGVRVSNAVLSEALVNGATEVPVNGAFTVTFAEPMDPASLTPSNIRLVPVGNGPVVTTTVTTDGLAQPLAVTLTSSGLAHLSGTVDGRYAVELLGGAGGVTSANGHPLDADVRVAFTTSPATLLTLSPPEQQLSPNVLVPLVASRALHPPSITSETVFATLAGNRINGIVALQPAQPRAATYIANPTWLVNNAGPYAVATSTGVLDHRGNPVPAVTSQAYTSGNTPSNAAIQPTLLTTANVSQTPNSQSFIVVLGGTGLKERMLSTSYYSLPPSAGTDGTVSLEAQGGSGCPATGTRLHLETVLTPSTSAGIQDKVNTRVLGPAFMKSGCQYTLKVRQAKTANLYNQGQGPEVAYLAIGESTAPTLSALEVQRTDGTFTAITGANQAAGRTVVRATFSEPLAPETVTAIHFNVAVPSGTLPGTLTQSGNVVTWTSSGKLSAGTNVTVTLSNGLKDLATNAFAGTSQSFSVESATPNFTGVTWDAVVSRDAPFGTAVLTFSEPLDPDTLGCNTQGATGSVSITSGGAPLFGCAVQSGSNPLQVLWRPAEPLSSGAAVDVTVNGAGVASLLKDLAGTSVPQTARSFTP